MIVPPLAADSPIRWLLDHHLLVQVNDDTVELPREVALLLRRDAGPLGRLHPVPPDVSPRRASGADRAGAGQALEVVRRAEAVLEALARRAGRGAAGGWARRPRPAPGRRASPGSARPTRRCCWRSTTRPACSATTTPGSCPPAAYDGWQVSPLAQRWRILAAAWLTMPRSAALVGQRDDRDRPIAALSAEAERLGAPAGRRAVLDVLAGLPKSAAPERRRRRRDPGLAGAAPHQPQPRRVPAETVLAEAATLGLTGLGALTGYARALLRELDGARSTPTIRSASAATDRSPTPRRRWPRCCPHRSTPSWCRPTCR